MKILSVDTASNICGVSILDNNDNIYNSDLDTGRTHSENLMPMIDEAFKKSNLLLSDMDLLVCDIGPGSFTGLRIGVATIKAFKDSFNIPSVGISSLQVLAYNLKDLINYNDFVISIIDCKNNNCYFALYKKDENNIMRTLISPSAEDIDSALSVIFSYIEDNNCSNSNIYFVGDGSIIYKDNILSYFSFANFTEGKYNILNSYSLGLAGLDFYNNYGISEDNNLLPLYLKKPQAQRLLEEREKLLNSKNNNK